jgi:hypothetical protein
MMGFAQKGNKNGEEEELGRVRRRGGISKRIIGHFSNETEKKRYGRKHNTKGKKVKVIEACRHKKEEGFIELHSRLAAGGSCSWLVGSR